MFQLGVIYFFCFLCAFVYSRCPNSCSGHGLCGTSNICTCFDGWNGGAPDCSFRNCPNGTAWADKAYALDAAHQSAECSNAGICDRATGMCKCFDGFTGAACQRSECPNDCSGHGTCSTIKDVSLYSGPDYDSTVYNSGDGLGSVYTNWDKNSIQLCECDDGYFGSDCSQVMCPKGDDPLTINQNYRSIQLQILCTGSYPIAGKLGLEFMGETVFIDTTNPSDQECTTALAFNGKFGNVDCKLIGNSDYDKVFQITFYSWPTFPKENNLYSNDGNPSRYDFYCDVSQSSPFTYCEFTDIVANNIREYAYCSNRGICNFATGICDCTEGFGGPACANATYLYTQGSNALPGLKVNVNGYDYTSSALQISSEKAKASDFNLIEAIAGSETVFYVQGDGTVGINKLVTLSGGQTVTGNGLYVESGGVTVAGDGLYAYSLDPVNPVVTIGSKYTGSLTSSYQALKVSTVGGNPNTHYLIQGYHSGTSKFSVRGDGAVMVRGGGLYVTSGASIFSGGLQVTSGMTVNTGGLRVGASGASITGGLTIGSDGAKIYGGMTSYSGLSIQAGGLKVIGGESINSGGLVVTGGATVFSGGITATGGLTVGNVGVYVAVGGLTVNNGGVVITQRGLTVAADGLVVTNKGVTITSGGLRVSGGLTVTTGGMVVTTGGLTVNQGGLMLISGGLTVSTGGLIATGGLTVNNFGVKVTGGLTLNDAGLVVSGGVTVVRGAITGIQSMLMTGGVTIYTGGLAVTGGVTVVGSLTVSSDGLVNGNMGVVGGLLVSGGLTVYGGTSLQTERVVFSDRRLKSNLMPISNALNKVARLNGVYFNWIKDEPTGLTFDTNRHVGVIAQDVFEVLPEVVEEKHNGLYLGVDYAQMVPLLIEAIHDLDELVSSEREKPILSGSSSSGGDNTERRAAGDSDSEVVISGLISDVNQLQKENEVLWQEVKGLRLEVESMKTAIAALTQTKNKEESESGGGNSVMSWLNSVLSFTPKNKK